MYPLFGYPSWDGHSYQQGQVRRLGRLDSRADGGRIHILLFMWSLTITRLVYPKMGKPSCKSLLGGSPQTGPRSSRAVCFYTSTTPRPWLFKTAKLNPSSDQNTNRVDGPWMVHRPSILRFSITGLYLFHLNKKQHHHLDQLMFNPRVSPLVCLLTLLASPKPINFCHQIIPTGLLLLQIHPLHNLQPPLNLQSNRRQSTIYLL